MGTNYYVKSSPCACCGHTPEALHIGKSSAGWTFALHVHPELGLNSLDDWKTYLSDKGIEDEYGQEISLTDLLITITDRSNKSGRPPGDYASWKQFHAANQSMAGPNGLVRWRTSDHCIGHGDGTWDLCVGNYF